MAAMKSVKIFRRRDGHEYMSIRATDMNQVGLAGRDQKIQAVGE